ncbi:MAG: N-acetyltransferase family protein [Dehalococcoidia bacterium]
MPDLTCLCGVTLTGRDHTDLVGAMRQHTDEAHADLALGDQDVADYVDAALRMGPPRPRVDVVEHLDVQPLTPDRLHDFLRFFDDEAFPDNPAWASCYCQFFYIADNERWQNQSAGDNRAAACDRIPSGQMTGYLAYVNGEPAGWCNAGPRPLYPRLDAESETGDGSTEMARTGSIVCFVIAPPYRRHGIAGQLLKVALDGFRSQGFTAAEAYPHREAGSDGAAFRGPRSLYESAGFVPFREMEKQTVMRLDLMQDSATR